MISAHLASLRVAGLHTIFRARCSWVVWAAEGRGGVPGLETGRGEAEPLGAVQR